MSRPRRRRPAVDPARRVAFDALRAVNGRDAYANLVLADLLTERGLTGRDAGFATELLHGTCRSQGSYDRIISAAAGRAINTLQPAVVDILRLGAHQLLAMRVPAHAAVDASVNLAAGTVGERVTGLVNAVMRKVARQDRREWNDQLRPQEPLEALALDHDHPAWIVAALGDALTAGVDTSSDELAQLLDADNLPPTPTLVVRPGLLERDDLVDVAAGSPTRWSPYGVTAAGFPGGLPPVRTGLAGVQDEGSQLMAHALANTAAPAGPWLDLCAGPGGKTALLRGLADAGGQPLVAAELQPHRAGLVQSSLRRYPSEGHLVVAADGTRPAWRPGSFARVLADVPCSGLGALRRRPESRWRRTPDTVSELVGLQQQLLHAAINAAMPATDQASGGVVAYVTCSPHVAETDEVVAAVLAQRDDVTVLDAVGHLPEMPGIRRREVAPGVFSVQLWPHRHGTDAMYLCLLQRR